MELPQAVKNPLSSFLHQKKPFTIPNTSFPSKKCTQAQKISSSPNPITPRTHFKSNQKLNLSQKNPYERTNNLEISVPTMSDIMGSSRAQNLDLQLQTFGPFFRITAESLETQRELGRAEGWLQRETLGMEKSIFGIGLFIGAVAIRHGYECGCRTAELLAINDTDLYHSKLVRFYKRIGFKEVYEVTGSSLGDLSHMLVWGGVGTRMDANLEDLMIKWCSRFKTTRPSN
ncbi:hypothetical protein Pfo_031105 [Paulownia fortunei]|nr:hypothetical protein Pfo_031105 [Paulownia fortunei]